MIETCYYGKKLSLKNIVLTRHQENTGFDTYLMVFVFRPDKVFMTGLKKIKPFGDILHVG